jgi:ATP-dependent DNA helicase RecQ
MAAFYPQSMASLQHISGVGQVKLNRYGNVFLETLISYCQRHGLKEQLPSPPHGKSATTGQPLRTIRTEVELGERSRLVAEAFNAGASVKELMARHQVTMGTILEHLTKYGMAGNTLRYDSELDTLVLVAPEQKQAAFAAFQELGTSLLRPVYERLNGTVNYDNLKILRLLYLVDQKTGQTTRPA